MGKPFVENKGKGKFRASSGGSSNEWWDDIPRRYGARYRSDPNLPTVREEYVDPHGAKGFEVPVPFDDHRTGKQRSGWRGREASDQGWRRGGGGGSSSWESTRWDAQSTWYRRW